MAGLSAWELACHAALTGMLQVSRHPRLSVSDRPIPGLTVPSGTQRARDPLLTISIPGRNSTAATLVKAGFVVVLVPLNVSGFRPVLARGWHGVRRYGPGPCWSKSTALQAAAAYQLCWPILGPPE
jgi:hypothetical protein